MKSDYEVGKQPCNQFTFWLGDLLETGIYSVHSCPRCKGERMFCATCRRDHHRGGWQTCKAWEKIMESETEVLSKRASDAESERRERDRRHKAELERCRMIQERALDLGYELIRSRDVRQGQEWVVWYKDEAGEVALDHSRYYEDAWQTACSRLGVYMESRGEWPVKIQRGDVEPPEVGE